MRMLITGILFIVGGGTGTMALRGTGSPIALVVVGALFLVVGVAQLAAPGQRSSPTRRATPRRARPIGRGTGRIPRRADATPPEQRPTEPAPRPFAAPSRTAMPVARRVAGRR